MRKTEEKKELAKCNRKGRAENSPQNHGLGPRLDGHGKAAGRARAGIVEEGFPKVWGRSKWLLPVVYPSSSPQKTLCSVILLRQNKVPGEWCSL